MPARRVGGPASDRPRTGAAKIIVARGQIVTSGRGPADYQNLL
jgi:hypothetical protein